MPRFTPLKELLYTRRIVQADLAEDAGISESRLSRIVNGRAQPYDYEKKNLARVLRIDTKDLPV